MRKLILFAIPPSLLKFIPVLLTLLFFNSQNLFSQSEGETLFQPCKACHNLSDQRLIGPGLKGITERRDRAWLTKFIQNSQAVIESGDEYAVKLFEEYNKIPMPPQNYTDEQVKVLLDYIESYDPNAVVATAQPAQATEIDGKPYEFMAETEHPWANFRLSFLVSVILIVISLIDLFITKIIKAKFIHIVIIVISAAVVAEITVLEAKMLGRQQYYEPDQPIAFSHYIHAGQNQIDCKYCHSSVLTSKSAGIPSTQLCMNCHTAVRKGTNSGTVEIEKIYKALETGKPIPWVRVHNLPDHAYFNHAQHVGAGKLDCTECHGDVTKMDRIRQVNNLGMGWCIQCHRTREVQFLSNEFYARYEKLHNEIKDGTRTMVTVDDIGGTECAQCHY